MKKAYRKISYFGNECKKLEKSLTSLPGRDVKSGLPENGEKLKKEKDNFFWGKHPVSLFFDEGMIYLSATEMGKCFGKIPGKWLSLLETLRFRQSLVQTGRSVDLGSQVLTFRGCFGSTWFQYFLARKYALWLSVEFAVWLERCLEEWKVKANFSSEPCCENFSTEMIMFKSSFIAEELGITTVEFNRFLVEEKICRFENRRYAVLPDYKNLQCDIPYRWKNRNGKTYIYSQQKRWTVEGRRFITALFKNKILKYSK